MTSLYTSSLLYLTIKNGPIDDLLQFSISVKQIFVDALLSIDVSVIPHLISITFRYKFLISRKRVILKLKILENPIRKVNCSILLIVDKYARSNNLFHHEYL
jgi:hypothetical protein